MPDRRQFVLGIAGALSGQVVRQSMAASRRAPGSVVIVRRGGRFAWVDPDSGEDGIIDLPANTRRFTFDPVSESIVVELETGSWRVGPSIGAATVVVDPVSPDDSPLLVGGRVLGATFAGEGVVVHDLVTGRSQQVTSDVLPGPPSGWRVHQHPVLPAAVLDARDAGGDIVLLSAGTGRSPQSLTVPPGATIGIAPDGAGLVRVDRAGDVSELVCMPANGEGSHDPLPRLMLGAGCGDVLGPIGASANVLLSVGTDRVLVVSCDEASPHLVDEVVINSLDGDSGVGPWFASPEGDAIIAGLTHGSLLSWSWWPVGSPPRMLPELPETLEPGAPAGAAGRWFHAADLSETSLGSGELRFMTIDMESGHVAFDHTVDRRLELAATGISKDGSLLAHCQSGNAEIEVLVASFGETVGSERFAIDIQDAPVAAAEIVLDVVATSGAGVVAAGLKWGNPDHHGPMVVMCAVGIEGTSAPVTVEGELIGVVPHL